MWYNHMRCWQLQKGLAHTCSCKVHPFNKDNWWGASLVPRLVSEPGNEANGEKKLPLTALQCTGGESSVCSPFQSIVIRWEERCMFPLSVHCNKMGRGRGQPEKLLQNLSSLNCELMMQRSQFRVGVISKCTEVLPAISRCLGSTLEC